MLLNGRWSGGCVYDSSQYGQLDGEIEFHFQQEKCSEIIIDGYRMLIPGTFEQESHYEDQKTTTRIDLSWADQLGRTLNYDYKMLTTRNSDVLDEVILNGHFMLKGSTLVMKQKGSVDSDRVQIHCEMIRRN